MKSKISSLVMTVITSIGIGMPVTLLCMILIGGYQSVMKEFIVWMIASVCYGLVSVVVFGTSKFNLPVATVLHCAGCLVITVGAGMLCGYSNNVWEILFSMLPVFVVIYAVIYGVSIISMKSQAKKVNEALKEKK